MNSSLESRIRAINEHTITKSLEESGYAVIRNLLIKSECDDLIHLYHDPSIFRSTINMKRHSFGVGEYKYFGDPLPPVIRDLRYHLYSLLYREARSWSTKLNIATEYPPTLDEFTQLCIHTGQDKPTPLLLRYEHDGYNCLHQDIYGEIFFPYQVVLMLNQPGDDYTGGEFLLVEQRPRLQSIGRVVILERGSALLFPTRYRPVRGKRGYYRTNIRHGVSTVTSGTRYTLGMIFHNAK